MTSPRVSVVQLPHAKGLELPTYATDGAAGADLRAALHDDVIIAVGDTALIPTGLQIALPPNTEAQVRPRSGLAAKHSVTVLNTPGTIDADYRGELHVILVNHGREPFKVTRGMRIAQIVIAPVLQATFMAETSLHQTERGEGGFGSTGTQ